MGQVSLEGMEFFAKHGYYEEERTIGNKYSVDITLDVDFTDATTDDKLEGTVNYEKVYEIVSDVMGNEAKLLEHLAGKIIKTIRSSFPSVRKVAVKVSKHNPPIKGLCKKATVSLEG
ncbi:MAG: dihydroneopterin aldolase [Ekhidna sp.]